ncbi:hypothetical protein BRC63_01230 [Halobacteriales archaeon QH_10_70_21]|nr:MAG: hypothetical protein BRC63_01230 [Halobacteriales archaeon QH_10_70_21]
MVCRHGHRRAGVEAASPPPLAVAVERDERLVGADEEPTVERPELLHRCQGRPAPGDRSVPDGCNPADVDVDAPAVGHERRSAARHGRPYLHARQVSAGSGSNGPSGTSAAARETAPTDARFSRPTTRIYGCL